VGSNAPNIIIDKTSIEEVIMMSVNRDRIKPIAMKNKDPAEVIANNLSICRIFPELIFL
jgi:hypothetical protein